MTPWTVAHVIGSLGIGGAERQLVNYLLAADHARFRHVVYCISHEGDLAGLVRSRGIEVRQQRIRERTLWRDLPLFVSSLKHERVDIVHAHMHHAAFFGRIAALLAGVPIRVVTEHGKELWKHRLQVTADTVLSRFTCRHIAVSEDGLRIRVQREKVPLERILLIPNGVSVPAAPPGEAARARARSDLNLPSLVPIIGTVGRFVEAKGYPVLLEAFRQLRAAHPDVLWLMIGDGPLRGELEAMIAAAGLAEAVVRPGMVCDANDFLPAMDVFVMPSIREGLPVALLEAMAAGRPIVATRVGGMPDAIADGETGLLVPAGDAGTLALAIATLLDDPARAGGMGRHAHAAATARYSAESVARQIEAVYDECLAARTLVPRARSNPS